MKAILNDAYNNPQKKNCFFTGQNHPGVGKALGRKNWDWTPGPSVNVEPWFWNTHTLALAFGCKPTFTSEGKEWIQDLITDPAQIADLEMPDVWAGRSGEILHKMEEKLKDYPEEVLIRLPDIQSPLGVAELMWDQSFYLALITDQESVHALLEKTMQFTINYVKEIKKVLGKRYNPSTHPQVWSEGDGYYMSDDVNSMVSPELHKEFSIDYFNRMTRELGPLFYHSCTWSDIYLENIAAIEGAKALNWSFGTSTDPAIILQKFSGQSVLVPHFSLDIHREEGVTKLNKNIKSELDLVKYLLDHMQENTSLYFSFDEGFCDEVNRMVEIYHLFERYGYAPPEG